MVDVEKLQFPIGKFVPEKEFSREKTNQIILNLENFPQQIDEIVEKLKQEDLDKTYRPQGWTARQVIHHIADSQMIFYLRMKLALTDDQPVVNAFNDTLWGELADNQLPIDYSLSIIRGIYPRLVEFIKSFSDEDFHLVYFNQKKEATKMYEILHFADWHGRHHLAHIQLILNSV
ncbi:MAG: putative metal-dependent hydrolase [Flavobacteriaceae bacterium]|nr:putative metal-dependent hydrolase [Flavobacteriaceae bacterium]